MVHALRPTQVRPDLLAQASAGTLVPGTHYIELERSPVGYR